MVVTINYRHAPEHVYPAAVEDCLTGLKWVLEASNVARLNINTALLTIGGVSALVDPPAPLLQPTQFLTQKSEVATSPQSSQ